MRAREHARPGRPPASAAAMRRAPRSCLASRRKRPRAGLPSDPRLKEWRPPGAMEFRILGPLEVIDERGVVALGGTKPRAVLAVLLLHANQPVSPEQLALALWGGEAP